MEAGKQLLDAEHEQLALLVCQVVKGGGGGILKCVQYLWPKRHERPAPTITGAHRGELALVEPRIRELYADYAEGELEGILTDNCCQIIEKSTGRTIAELDLLLRMLQPHELAAGMSFPDDYEFTGTKATQTKLIGNAVPVETATCMAEAMLKRYAFKSTVSRN